MYVVLWEYEVRAGSEPAFEALYGPNGEWVRLFHEYPGYRGTELLHAGSSRCYLTIDRWDSESVYSSFHNAAASRYAALDRLGDALTLLERHIGAYSSTDTSTC